MPEAEVRTSMGIKDPHHLSETVNTVINLREIRNDDLVEIEEIKDRIIDTPSQQRSQRQNTQSQPHYPPMVPIQYVMPGPMP